MAFLPCGNSFLSLLLHLSFYALIGAVDTTTASTITNGTYSLNPRCNASDPTTSTYVTTANQTCLDISIAANVSTPTLANINALGVDCNYLTANQTLCLPGICDIYLVQPNDTCTSILVNNVTRQVSLSTFRSWNPSINFLCSNLDSLVGEYICLSPPGSMTIPSFFPLQSATSAVAVPTNAVTTSNDNCGYWYTIQSGDSCESVTSEFGITEENFYFLNPQLNGTCAHLWQGNSYCVEPVGNIQTYSGYSTVTRSAYTTLATSMNLSATVTTNYSTTWLLPTTLTFSTTTSTYNSTPYEITQNYTLCQQALTYYNVTADDEFTDDMIDNTDWMSEYYRVCFLTLSDPLPTQPFNTSISLATSTTSVSMTTTTGPVTGASSPIMTAPVTTMMSISTSTSSTQPSSSGLSISPDGTCGDSNGYTCLGSQFGNCCDIYGYCGSASAYCGSDCDPNYGDCNVVSASTSPSSTSTSVAPTATSDISPNGLCGAANSGYTCLNSNFGDCCDTYGYCGSTSNYCAPNVCDSAYGSCDSNISSNGLCGSTNGGYTCLNSHFGNCCDIYGYCGSTSDYCSSDVCDSSYGQCNS